jgi:hypothetical protein
MRLRELFFENLDRTGESKSAVVGWGRGMGHKGHMMLASSVLTQANDASADPYFVISRTMGKDDPLSPEEKLQIYNKVFPNNPQVFRTATEEMPDLNRVLKKLATMGYGDVTVVVGADQVNAFQYLVRPDKSGVEPYKQFGLDSMNVIARQDTNDPSREEEGPRATPMRQALVDPNMNDQEKFDVWRDAMSPQLSDQEVRDLMATALQRMQDFSKPKVKTTKKKDMATAEEAAGVGIVTKQNSTADVGPGTLRKNLKAFNLTK